MVNDDELIRKMAEDPATAKLGTEFINRTAPYRYSYNFNWLGRPVIQFPQDMIAVQEIIWETRPDLIVETGIAHGGSLIFHASILQLAGGDGRVLGVDIDIRPHNRQAIEEHPLFERITILEGSSTDPGIVRRVREEAEGKERVMVILDSNHAHEHVERELQLYSPLVTRGCYLIVFDTVVEYMPEEAFPDRPWGPGDNPMTAVRAFLQRSNRFAVDAGIENKLLITVAPGGYLKCVAD